MGREHPERYYRLMRGGAEQRETGGWRQFAVVYENADWPEWTCPGCNGAISAMGEPAGIAIFTTLMITFFTMWNLLRR